MKMQSINRQTVAFSLIVMSAASGFVGCASSPEKVKYDPQAAERARPFLEGHRSMDLRLPVGRAVLCADPKADGTWKDWVAAATACAQKEDWAQLERVGMEISKREVNSPWGAYFLGVAAAGKGDLTRAYWMLDLAEKKAGGPMALVRYERARLLEREQGPAASASEVAKEMKEAIRLDPELLPALSWLAQVYHRDRMLSEAEGYYRQVLKMKGDHWPSLAGLAEVAIEKNNADEAVDLLSKAVTLRPEVAETRVRLAYVYENMKKDQAKSLETLRELKVAVEKGRAKSKTADLVSSLNQKIRTLEQALKAVPAEQAKGREPAQKKGG